MVPSNNDPKLLRNVKDRSPEWVLDGLVAKRCISMVASPMNMGKTHVGVWMAKEASMGSPLAMDEPQAVWFNTLEDDPEMVLRPRMMVAGAHPDRVTLTSEQWQFPRDLQLVRAELEKRPVGLLILDSVQTHLPGFANTRPAEEAMQGLTALSMDLNLAIVLIHHFTKATASSARTSIGGAAVIQNLARGGIFIVGPKPTTVDDLAKHLTTASSDDAGVREEEEPEEYVLACVRCGIGRTPDSLLFQLVTQYYEGTGREEAHLSLMGSVGLSAEEIFNAIKDVTRSKSATKATKAIAWLFDTLMVNGPTPVKTVEAEAKAVGIAKRTLERARAEATSSGLIEVIRPEQINELVGDEAYKRLNDERRRGFWLAVAEVGEPPIEEWMEKE